MTTIAELDDAICRYITGTYGICAPVLSSQLQALAQKCIDSGLVKQRTRSPTLGWRLIDRRMQAMRKVGRLRYVRETGLKPRWEVVT